MLAGGPSLIIAGISLRAYGRTSGGEGRSAAREDGPAECGEGGGLLSCPSLSNSCEYWGKDFFAGNERGREENTLFYGLR